MCGDPKAASMACIALASCLTSSARTSKDHTVSADRGGAEGTVVQVDCWLPMDHPDFDAREGRETAGDTRVNAGGQAGRDG